MRFCLQNQTQFMRWNKSFFIFYPVLFILAACSFGSCDDELFTDNPQKTLTFSTDTLTFDTVFTTIGSTTEKFLVYNRNNRALHISSIGLAGGKNSQFRLNVDGNTSADNQFRNIDISANDSLYIFVEVTVDPNNADSPILIDDSVVFQTNGVEQRVRLEAFGQDMILMRNKTILNDTTLSAQRPYLIYGYLAVDSAKTLNIPAGCQLYFHNNADLIVYGNLKAEGTFEKPIEMRGDRLDKVKFMDPVPYNYIAGQWGGLYLLWNKGNHVLRHVNINSGYVGVSFSNNDRNFLPSLEITDCRIHNFVYYGLVAQNGNVTVSNSEISNTGSYSVYLSGGKHVFVQSTIANYYNGNSFEPTSRDKNPAVMIMGLYRTAPMETKFQNCIISGGLETELSIASRFISQYKGVFSNSYIRRKVPYELSQFQNIRWYAVQDTVFKQARFDYEKKRYFDFTPDSVSPARGLADPEIAKHFPLDLNGNSRLEDNAPDAGAYEWKPTK